MSNPKSYTVGWICAISTEYVAAQAFLDERHEGPDNVAVNDNNDYTLGKIGRHNVVIAVLPDGEYGTASAAMVARDMLHSFPNVRIGLMVGIGGGAPSLRHDIRLGDVVVSESGGGMGGVFQYDFGKAMQGQGFQNTGVLNQPPTIVRTAVSGLKAKYKLDGHVLEAKINSILDQKPRLKSEFQRPEDSSDRLYLSSVVHPPNNDQACTEVCSVDSSLLVSRNKRTDLEDTPAIHYGLIASANTLMKDALIRDSLAAGTGIKTEGVIGQEVLCFEMEAAGLMNHFPCLVIRGVCDYSDTHKNKIWQGYAAMTAAAYARDILCRIAPNQIEAEKSLSEAFKNTIQDISQTKAHVEVIRSRQDDVEAMKMFNWLTEIDYAAEQHDFSSRRQQGTGQWFLNSEEFLSFLSLGPEKQTLLCPGIPGAGKTILASTIIEHIENRFQSDSNIGIAYLYCNYRRTHEQKVKDLLSSLLRQLVQRLPKAPAPMISLYEHHRSHQTRPSADEFFKALCSVSSEFSKVFIVVDALDECEQNGSLISEIFVLQAKVGVNFLATCRPIREITDHFQCGHQLEIRATDDDLRRYLDGRMVSLRKCVRKSTALQEIIKQKVVKAVDGMFLLAQLHIDSLKDKTTDRTIKQALENLPQGSSELYQAYDQAVERIEAQQSGFVKLAKRVISWITCAKRPLTSIELQHALAVDPGDSELGEDNLQDIDEMVSTCAGLVTVDEQSDIVGLVHYTTQNYFVQIKDKWFPNAEADIMTTCITYLSFETFQRGSCARGVAFRGRLYTHKLYSYAAHHWGDHARSASTPYQSIRSFLEKTPQVDAAAQALKGFRHAKLHFTIKELYQKRMVAIHLLAYFGLYESIAFLIEKNPFDLGDREGRTPLSFAAENGHIDVVTLLLEKGAEVDSADHQSQTPLLYGAEKGHVDIVKLLLEKGAQIESRDRNAKTPLLYAVENRDMDIVKLLLEKGAQIESRDRNAKTPLLYAIENRNMDIVKLLLEKGAQIESRDRNAKTPLLYAIENRNMDIVKLLLEKGAQIESRDRNAKTPLLNAIENRNMDIMKLLLEKGADIDLADGLGYTPLSKAATNGHIDVVTLLLEKGADVDLVDGLGYTPLLWATRNGHIDVVTLLIKKGADIDLVGKSGFTPLKDAIRNGRIDVVILLLETKADVNLADELGYTPLLYATTDGHINVVTLLLEKGAEVDLADKNGRTPLFYAIDHGHVKVAALLLENGAKVDSVDNYGETPLMWAASDGNVALCKVLLENGAAIDFVTPNGGTVLQYAKHKGFADIVALLKSNGKS